MTGLLHAGPALADKHADVRPAAQDATTTLHTWNNVALAAVRKAQSIDAAAARTYAMVNVAIYDAVNSIVSRGGRANAVVNAGDAPFEANLSATIAGAAHAVLVAVFPDQAATFDAQLAADRAALGHGGRVTTGLAWGAFVGNAVVARRAHDGASPAETVPAATGVGVFRASWSNAQYRNLAPFAIADAGPYVAGPPPDLNSPAYAGAVNEIKVIGNAAATDVEATNRFQFWNLAAGTDQPAGEWLKIAIEVAEAQHVRLADEVRLLALVSMAEADVVAPIYMSKFVYAEWRPATAIIEAGTDNNPFTDPDPSWKPRAGGIGGNPAHTSGHSAFSAAAAAVLDGFFCRDDIAFTHTNDGAPNGAARSYAGFQAAVFEAGRSRVEGGIHFEFNNQAGLAAGRGVGAEILAHSLLRVSAQTHFGTCPL
ncbi:MAG TPA: vanadium-dependent haloperoxidase [Kofleriaceae bacterium]|nr:vanadium-dependent haloperoxidase [Kofleriaceae bacterium]